DGVRHEQCTGGVEAEREDAHRLGVVVAQPALAAVATDAFGTAAAYEAPDPTTVGEDRGLPGLFTSYRPDVFIKGPRRLQDLVVQSRSGRVVAAGGEPRHRSQQRFHLRGTVAEVGLFDRVGRVDRAPGREQCGVLRTGQNRPGVGRGDRVADRLEGDRGDLGLD